MVEWHLMTSSNQINIDFCGAWAGNVYSQYANCPQTANASSLNSCVKFVGNNPANLSRAYWEINSLKVYQMPNNIATTSTYSTSLSSIAPSASSNTINLGMGASTAVLSSSVYTGPLSSLTSTNSNATSTLGSSALGSSAPSSSALSSSANTSPSSTATSTTSSATSYASGVICPPYNQSVYTDNNGQQYVSLKRVPTVCPRCRLTVLVFFSSKSAVVWTTMVVQEAWAGTLDLPTLKPASNIATGRMAVGLSFTLAATATRRSSQVYTPPTALPMPA